MFKDNPTILRAAADYIECHRETHAAYLSRKNVRIQYSPGKFQYSQVTPVTSIR
jgi:hypothetical protein